MEDSGDDWDADDFDVEDALTKNTEAKTKASAEDNEEDEAPPRAVGEGGRGGAGAGGGHAEGGGAAEAAEPLRQRKVIPKDSMKELELNLQKDVDVLVKMVVPKLKEAPAKKASSKFLNDLLSNLQGKLTLVEGEALQKVIKEYLNQRKKEEKEAQKKREIAKAAQEKADKEKADKYAKQAQELRAAVDQERQKVEEMPEDNEDKNNALIALAGQEALCVAIEALALRAAVEVQRKLVDKMKDETAKEERLVEFAAKETECRKKEVEAAKLNREFLEEERERVELIRDEDDKQYALDVLASQEADCEAMEAQAVAPALREAVEQERKRVEEMPDGPDKRKAQTALSEQEEECKVKEAKAAAPRRAAEPEAEVSNEDFFKDFL